MLGLLLLGLGYHHCAAGMLHKLPKIYQIWSLGELDLESNEHQRLLDKTGFAHIDEYWKKLHFEQDAPQGFRFKQTKDVSFLSSMVRLF